MTRRHELNLHREQLHEIRNIMYSMKTLAIMETHKLDRFIKTQATMTNTIKNIATDFLHFHPQVLPDIEPVSNIIILIGTERGFCGDFNEQLIRQLDRSFTKEIIKNSALIFVGNKLHTVSDNTSPNVTFLEGASVVEEVFNVVNSLADQLTNYQQPSSLYVVYHNPHHNKPITVKLLPPFQNLRDKKSAHSSPPLLNISAKDFLLDLTDHYLFNSIHRILYASLMIENQYRTQHLENATHHLDEKTDELKHKINTLRQEEIIEEIEVILINASATKL